MAENPTEYSHSRLVKLSLPADRDQSIIFTYSAQQWGIDQAEKYLDFPDTIMQQLADQPELAATIPNDKNTRVFIARWKNAHDGHRIFFTEIEDGIYIVRILHTSMNWSDYFG